MNLRDDLLMLAAVARYGGLRPAVQLFIRGLTSGDSVAYWLVVATFIGGLIGLATADWAVVPR